MGSIAKWSVVWALVSTAAGAASAQTVRVVDPSNGPGTDFTNLPTAVAAAQDGDVLLLRSGTYDELVIASKSLTVVADQGSVVTITDTLHVETLTANQSVAIRGLRVVASELSYSASLENCAGPIWIENCSFEGTSPTLVSGGIFVANCDGVAFMRSNSTPILEGSASGRQGLLTIDSNVDAYDCVFVGTHGIETISNPIAGAAGTSVIGGFFFGAGCTFQGGDGGDGIPKLIGCMDGADGGEGLRITGGVPTVFLLQNALSGGAAGAAGTAPCTPGHLGKPIVFQSGSVTALVDDFRGMTTNSPRREGQVFQETFSGQPGELVAVAISLGQTEAVFFANLLGASHLDQPALFQVRGIVPASGTLVKSLTVPQFVPGVETIVIYEQPIFFELGTGNAAIGAPSQSVFLDDSF